VDEILNHDRVGSRPRERHEPVGLLIVGRRAGNPRAEGHLLPDVLEGAVPAELVRGVGIGRALARGEPDEQGRRYEAPARGGAGSTAASRTAPVGDQGWHLGSPNRAPAGYARPHPL
jgi:hypothetical protein